MPTPSPSPRWPARPPHDWPTPAPPDDDGTPDDEAPEPWASWHVVLIATAALLLGFTIGLVIGMRDDDGVGVPEQSLLELRRSSPTTVLRFGNEPPPPGTEQPGTGQPDTTTTTTEPLGSAANPVPLGTGYMVGAELVVRVVEVDPDAAGALGPRSETTDAARRSVLVTLELDYGGRSPVRFPGGMVFYAADGTGSLYVDGGCGSIPDPLVDVTALDPGDVVHANVCFDVAAERVGDLVLVAELDPDLPVRYSLAP